MDDKVFSGKLVEGEVKLDGAAGEEDWINEIPASSFTFENTDDDDERESDGSRENIELRDGKIAENCISSILLSQLEKTSSYEQRCGFSMQFSFQYFFHFMDGLFPWNCTIDFKLILLDFAIDFAIFTMWLQTYEWMDG